MASIEMLPPQPGTAPSGKESPWERCLLDAGALGAMSLFLVGVVLGDLQAVAVSVGYALSVILLCQGRVRLGVAGIALISLSLVEFICRIPGRPKAGMTGTLVVQGK